MSDFKTRLSTEKSELDEKITKLSASVDRIDSSKGYTKDNVQYVSTAINFMKSDMSHEETVQLCDLIAKNLGLNGIDGYEL